MTRPVMRVRCGCPVHAGMESQTSHVAPPPGSSTPLTHSVGPVMPPMQVSVAASQLRPSEAQLNCVPQSSMAIPHSQPMAAQLVDAVHGGVGGRSHWNGVTTLQYCP